MSTNTTTDLGIVNGIDMSAGGLVLDRWNEALRPRPYQNQCIRAILDAAAERVRRMACVLPTGSGKTVIFSYLAKHWNEYGFSGRILIVVDTDELVNQTVDKLSKIAPLLKVGVVKAERDEHENVNAIVASVQTIRKLYRLDNIMESGRIGLVIIDECDRAAAEGYVNVLNALGCFNPDDDTVAVGFTATLARTDMRSLGDIWERVVFQRDILDMIPEYLVDVSGKMVTVDGFSLSQVAMRGGDYAIKSLSDALLSSDAPEFIANAYVEHAVDKPGIIFTPSVATAEAFTAALQARGIEARTISGTTPRETRRQILRDAHAGRVQVLVNCMVLTRGFDWPRAEVAVIARPTTSNVLYVQMVGRVLRQYPGYKALGIPAKEKALVLDIVGATQEHRLATLAVLTSNRIQVIQEGETLTEAVQRERAAGNEYLKDYVVLYQDVDLFHRSEAVWLQTYEGVWFVSTRDDVYFIWPGSEPDRYHVGVRPLKGQLTSQHGWKHKDVDLETAMAWAEQEALAADPMTARRKASWRVGRQKPSEGQLRFAERLGLDTPEGITKREISDMIDVRLVSRILDKSIRRGKVKR